MKKGLRFRHCNPFLLGGADGIRTHDLCVANASLSQLSHCPHSDFLKYGLSLAPHSGCFKPKRMLKANRKPILTTHSSPRGTRSRHRVRRERIPFLRIGERPILQKPDGFPHSPRSQRLRGEGILFCVPLRLSTPEAFGWWFLILSDPHTSPHRHPKPTWRNPACNHCRQNIR